MVKMLILSGGLGNQMFEYAFFLSCKARGMKVRLNRSLYEYNRMHNGYLLDTVFGVPDKEVMDVNRMTVLATRILRRYHPCCLVYAEQALTFCDDAYTTKRPFYDGVFISELYFKEIEDRIRQAFVFRSIDPDNINLGKKMLSEDSVSLHIRRGDYLSSPEYGVCDEAYYQKAIDCIKKRIRHPMFYVFSDDSAWGESFMQKMAVDYKVVRHNTGVDSYKDMYLMTRCRHNIIANSTFSWWGAWLNDNEQKIVVAPKRWIKSKNVQPNAVGWYEIDN